VIRLRRNGVQRLDCNEVLFKQVVKAGFNQRRKMLRNALKPLAPPRPCSTTPCSTNAPNSSPSPTSSTSRKKWETGNRRKGDRRRAYPCKAENSGQCGLMKPKGEKEKGRQESRVLPVFLFPFLPFHHQPGPESRPSTFPIRLPSYGLLLMRSLHLDCRYVFEVGSDRGSERVVRVCPADHFGNVAATRKPK
jgi:hypothetical protein